MTSDAVVIREDSDFKSFDSQIALARFFFASGREKPHCRAARFVFRPMFGASKEKNLLVLVQFFC